DAEDAFQATFLVLVRRADSLKNPELLGNWLYGVASRTARKARAQGDRRRQQERQAPPVASETEPASDLAWRELRAALDEELSCLPEKYQLPLILCYLQGLTNEEAARRLGWPVGSMSHRLARGRELLRERMQRRNRNAPAGFFSLAMVLGVGSGAVPAHLAQSTVRAAVLAASSGPFASLAVSTSVRALAETTLKSVPVSGPRRWLRSLFPLGFAIIAAFTLTMVVAFAGEISMFRGGKSSRSDAGSMSGTNGMPMSGSNSAAPGGNGPAQQPISGPSCHGP
ncbi:MAG TPA: sigma-70 family RNA polymerase sigma factor, partial [Gemmataceae bacterium]|nr:sigma-70 family RNA polymerase sigma factor [Gemmataceae bacterium]